MQITVPPYLEKNLQAVRQEIAAATAAAGRASAPAMVAAVKYASPEELSGLFAFGVTAVGENRVQQLLEHWPILSERAAEVHFIGHLQKNKVKYLIDKVKMIHSVDSEALAAEIERQAERRGLQMDVLVEINSGREADKSGVLPEDAEALCRSILSMPHLRLRGLMTMGPRCNGEAEYRIYFAETRRLARELWEKLQLPDTPLLSMGMSESFSAAIAEGADLVRVGRRLFAHEE
jgi:pyridoxal phosphate enzyme (YggS family)